MTDGASAAGAAGKLLGSVAPLLKGLWRRFRYGPRLVIELDWRGTGIHFVGGTNTLWRAILLRLTASKDEEFAVASGVVEARPAGARKWTAVGQLREFIPLPARVQPNREWEQRIDGPSVVKRLPPHLAAGELLELRVVAHDYHRGRVVSGVLTVTVAELQRERQR